MSTIKKVKEKRPVVLYAMDFETSVYEGQVCTEVWSSALAPLTAEDDYVIVHGSIKETYDYLVNLKNVDIIGYYHNLKFDGTFWVDWLLRNGFKFIDGVKPDELKDHEGTATISAQGMWYKFCIKVGEQLITFKDSLKLIPFTLAQAGKAFNTTHQKLEMNYVGERHAGCNITPEELNYIRNDVLVLKECLNFMFKNGHNKLTIGACCLSEFNSGFTKEYRDYIFPDLTRIGLDEKIYGAKTADEYIRRSYHGGWCYLNPDRANKMLGSGVTADVNSLYPSMMSSQSGNLYPVGKPMFWEGDYIPEKALRKNHYYFITIKCSFYIKPKHLPFIQIKGSPFYKPTEMLRTSKPSYKGKRYDKINADDGVHTDIITLTLTQTDYKLLHEHYNVYDEKILHGCYFWADIGLFDPYIKKYSEIKKTSKGAMRTLAKLFLNSLYGKLAASDDSSYETPYLDVKTNTVKYKVVLENNKRAGYIPIGSAITSYARAFTIKAAQSNYDSFVYADTDSIHCTCKGSDIKGIKVHPTEFCHWKLESDWDCGIFVRQKTYIEHVIAEDTEPVEEPYYNIKCAGMSKKPKEDFCKGLEQGTYTLNDFKIGLTLGGKLVPVRMPGGLVLMETSFTMK